MKIHSQNSSAASQIVPVSRRALPTVVALAALAAGLWPMSAAAQNFPITPGQRSTAQQVAQQGVPLSELAPNAPDEYTVKRGDTLWAISGIFLKSPWRWPELWGMNMEQVRNPHLIFPGQLLVLEKKDGRAILRMGRGPAGAEPTDTVRVSPRVRVESMADLSVPALKTHLIEPFLAEALIIDEATLLAAPRIVAGPEERVLITRGDRAYARGLVTTPLKQRVAGRADDYRVFRNARPLKDPLTSVVLGYEAMYLGRAQLVRDESIEPVRASSGKSENTVIPGTIDITAAKEEMRVGDRLLPEPARQFQAYVPHAPSMPVDAAIVSVYGDAVSFVGQNQVVVINKGTADGVEVGHVMAILRDGERRIDRTQPGERTNIKIPDERTGLLMVFRPFDKLSYALVLEISSTVKVGDRVVNPR
ncbi:LysM peptidoglycan-binding domain-containing protein [Caenimonas sp. SL110]|uniref:LysM peptidoglycan-binding domain-containing protein n=1 Tax=Caenimonas sp. SL110 TaxID=1450524 RepID=UPI00069F7332|nr:LysM peptidoglycan-binding domain-containing protein [Caenimonas sp. SL110]